jgi:hypothetical protein
MSAALELRTTSPVFAASRAAMRLPPLAALFYSLNSLCARHRAFNSTLNSEIIHAVSRRRHPPLQSRSVAV